jgi:serpin B
MRRFHPARLAGVAAACLAWLGVAGCQPGSSGPPRGLAVTDGQPEGPRGGPPTVAGQQLPPPDSPEVQQFVEAQNKFALALYARFAVQATDSNLVMSPFAVTESLALLRRGAGGATGKELADKLGLALPPDRLALALAAIDYDIRGSLVRTTPAAPRLGLQVTEENKALVITDVVPGSPAAAAGLAKGQVIVAVDGRAVATVADYLRETDRVQPGLIRVEVRFGQNSTTAYRLRPSNAAAPFGAPSQYAVLNGLWGRPGVGFRPEFLGPARDFFQATVEEAAFNNPAAAQATINDWFKRETDGRVPQFLASPPDPGTALLPTSGLHLSAVWKFPFDPQNTGVAQFDGRGKRLRSRVLVGSFPRLRNYKTTGVEVVELPLAGGDVVMCVFLPDPPADHSDGLPAFEKGLTYEKLVKLLGGLKERSVRVQLPRFEASGVVELAKAMQDLGATQAFSPQADFSGLTEQKGVRLGSVMHRAAVKVDESGVNDPGPGEFTGPVSPSNVFTANRPFLFVIRHIPTGAILHIGRVVAPEEAKAPGAD